AGDVLLGLESAGLHSNGYTLARRVLFETGRLTLETRVPELGSTLADELLKPTHIYVKPILALLDAGLPIHALAHLTADRLFHLGRTVAPVGFDIEQWPEPPAIFSLLQRLGDIADEEMFRVFNMGIGFAVLVGSERADAARRQLTDAGLVVHVLGVATDDPERPIRFRPRRLVGRAGTFVRG